MSVDAWNPDDTAKPASIGGDFLSRCIEHADSGRLENLSEVMTVEDQRNSAVMHADQQIWETALAELDDIQLLALIRFFTVAEMSLPGWQAGSQSPVIAINQLLKKRGHKLDREMLQWIRDNSTNRFIPNGAVL